MIFIDTPPWKHLPQSRILALIFSSVLVVFAVWGVSNTALAGMKRQKELTYGTIPNIRLHVENSARYAVDTEYGIHDWSALIPSNGHMTVGHDRRPYSVAMFHQLHCLDVIRHEYTVRGSRAPPESALHCLNYLRQTILCHTTMRLEPIIGFHPPGVLLEFTDEYACRDWTTMYSSIKQNADSKAG